jgi:hypothetical protein
VKVPIALVAAVAVAGLGVVSMHDAEPLSGSKFWHDHGERILFFGADIVLAGFVAARWWAQAKINSNNEAVIQRLVSAAADNEKRLAVLEGIAHERGKRLLKLVEQGDNLRERTVILRDCDEEHEKRIIQMEDKLRIARDRAAARLALRGEAFRHDGTGDPGAGNDS